MTATATQMQVAIGQKANLSIEGLQVRVHILDVRQSWNRIDCLVQPCDGHGTKWVSAERILILS